MLDRTRTFLRRFRGCLGNGLVWAAGWVLGTLAFAVAPLLVAGVAVPPIVVVPNLVFAGGLGCAASIGSLRIARLGLSAPPSDLDLTHISRGTEAGTPRVT